MRTLPGILLALFFLLSAGATHAAKKVDFFKGSWDELLAEAKKEGKPFFVDFSTSWCGWCKVMDRKTFGDKKVAEYVEAHYVAYKLDAEAGEGPELARKYEITGYPTVILFDHEGNVLVKLVGYKDADAFLAALKQYEEAGTRKSRRNRRADDGGEYASATMGDYIQLKEKAMENLWASLYEEQPEFKKLVQDAWQYGEQKALYQYEMMFEQEAVASLTETQKNLLNAYYLLGDEEFDELLSLLERMNAQEQLSTGEQHFFAWQFLHSESEELPHAPMRWVNNVVRKYECYAAYDTKAALKLRDGKPGQALEAAEEALKLAAKEEVDPQRTEMLIAIIKREL